MKPAIVSIVMPATGCAPIIDRLHSAEFWHDVDWSFGCIDAPEFLPRGSTVTDFFDDPIFAGLTHSNTLRPRFSS